MQADFIFQEQFSNFAHNFKYMETNNIYEFVCFETLLELKDFRQQWDEFAKVFLEKGVQRIVLNKKNGEKIKYRYISKKQWPLDSFQDVFSESKIPGSFAASQVKVVPTGGYASVEMGHDKKTGKAEVQVIVFVHDDIIDIKKLRESKSFKSMNIYEAFYQNSQYNYIIEFFTDKANQDALIAEIKNEFMKAEIGIYAEAASIMS